MNDLRTVLITNTETSQISQISHALRNEKLAIEIAPNQYAALERIERLNLSAIIVPLRSDRIEPLKLLRAAQKENPEIGIIFFASPSVMKSEIAIRAMSLHENYHFLTLPVSRVQIRSTISRVIEDQRLRDENRKLISQIDSKIGLLKLVGNSSKIEKIRKLISQIAPTQATVMIRGEHGTGKKLIARSLHHRGLRKGQLIIFDCSAISGLIADVELFGHEKDPFNEPYHTRKGRLELANGGTLFLDRIENLSHSNQARLLRFLADREFERIGGTETINVNVRIVCASHRDLEKAVDQGKFIHDLYDRLNAVTIEMPPLRDRKEDLPLLIKVFVDEFCRANRLAPKAISPEAVRILTRYDWHGNVRELRNTIEGIVILSKRSEIGISEIPDRILNAVHFDYPPQISSQLITETVDDLGQKIIPINVGTSLTTAEKEILQATLEFTNWNQTQTAKILEVSRQTVFRKIKEYQLCQTVTDSSTK